MGESIERVNQPKEKQISTEFAPGKIDCANEDSTDSEDAQIVPDVDHSPVKQIKNIDKENHDVLLSPEGNVEMYDINCNEKTPTQINDEQVKEKLPERLPENSNTTTSEGHENIQNDAKITKTTGQDSEHLISASIKSEEGGSKEIANEDKASNSSKDLESEEGLKGSSSKQGIDKKEDTVNKMEPKFGLTAEMIEEEEKLKQEQEKQLDEIKNKVCFCNSFLLEVFSA